MIETKDLPKPQDLYVVRRALISVYDKAGIADFARGLSALGVEIISTGGTAKAIRDAGVAVTDVSQLTGFPEILGGRVKTLHPIVHGALLARRNDHDDLGELESHSIAPIDLVVVNLYPFAEATSDVDVTDAMAVENIDIGGPTMVRAAAKNFFFVAVATSPADYGGILAEMGGNGGALSMNTRRRLAKQAFEHTAVYDAAIHRYLSASSVNGSSRLGDHFAVDLPLAQQMRYGENPHQRAALYGSPGDFYEQLHGKELSFNNVLDLTAALNLIDEFRDDDPTVAILKHTNPCGVAVASTPLEAYRRAFTTDRQSPFGGIVVLNVTLDMKTAAAIDEVFTEIIIAPDYEDGVIDFLKQKKNRRIIRQTKTVSADRSLDVRTVVGGLLVQDRDPSLPPFSEMEQRFSVVTKRSPTPAEMRDLDFAWRIVKAVKSNAIIYARDRATLGVGAGQMSRIDASELAVAKGRKSELDFTDCVVASDAFFPFADGLVAAAEAGAVAAIQPGGSVRDEEVINAADNHGMAMIFTGTRHFRH